MKQLLIGQLVVLIRRLISFLVLMQVSTIILYSETSLERPPVLKDH